MPPAPRRTVAPPTSVRGRKHTDGDTDGPILVVGEVEEWRALGRDLPHGGTLVFVALHELETALATGKEPQVVFSPLVCAQFDCLDVAQRLTDLGYGGRYRAFSPDLPNPDLILDEIAAICPDLDFAIVLLAEVPPARLN